MSIDAKSFFAQFAANNSNSVPAAASQPDDARKAALRAKLASAPVARPSRKRAKTDSGASAATAIDLSDDAEESASSSSSSSSDSKQQQSPKPSKKRKKPAAAADPAKLALKVGLPPILPSSSDPLPHTLVLGSGPSDASLKEQKYYAHAQNAFWKVMGSILGFDSNLPYEQRTAQLTRHGIVLWDVLASFKRQGSMDNAIQSPVVNNFAAFFAEHPSIRSIGLNGGSAAAFFKKEVMKQTRGSKGRGLVPANVRVVQLPSTSPAHAMKDAVQVKTQKWHELLFENRSAAELLAAREFPEQEASSSSSSASSASACENPREADDLASSSSSSSLDGGSSLFTRKTS